MFNVVKYPLWTAVVTPMFPDGSIDFDGLKNLLEFQAKTNLGVVLLGSTGEGLSLGLEEKKRVLEFAVGLELKIPLMVGIPGFDLTQTLEWIDYCETLPISAYLMVVPLYSKPGPKGQELWFKSLMDKATRPCMLYNIPSRSGTFLHLETVKSLSFHPNFWAIKEASGSPEKFKEYVKQAPKIMVYSGDDELTPAFAPLGAKGLISVASNVWPRETALYVNYCLKGKSALTSPVWGQACKALFMATNPIPVKALLHLRGMIAHSSVRLPLSDLDLGETDTLEKADRLIREWYEAHSKESK
jgi:4-hydroxy-tetrahydrodipicolinate synthase